MGPFCRRLVRAVGVALLVAVSATPAPADDQLRLATVPATPASTSTDEPPSLPAADESSRPSTAAPTAASAPVDVEAVKIPLLKPSLRRGGLPAGRAATMREAPVSNQSRYALGFYGGTPARQTLSQFPTRTPIQSGPPPSMRQQIKPFHTIYRDPTVSPYLNLYRPEDDTESAPNYFAFVRPQMEQIEANRVQQSEIQQLRRRLQSRSSTVAAPQYQPSTRPAARTPSRYMDTAQFYGGWAN